MIETIGWLTPDKTILITALVSAVGYLIVFIWSEKQKEKE